jgi:hypothetical protein
MLGPDLLLLFLLFGLLFLLILSGLLLLLLRDRLVDLRDSLNKFHNDISALGGRSEDRRFTGGHGRVGREERGELLGAVSTDDDNTDRLAEVRGNGDGGVDGLVDVLDVELRDEGGLEGGTTRGKLRGVEGDGVGGGGVDGDGLREESTETLGDLGGVRGSTGEDDLDA